MCWEGRSPWRSHGHSRVNPKGWMVSGELCRAGQLYGVSRGALHPALCSARQAYIWAPSTRGSGISSARDCFFYLTACDVCFFFSTNVFGPFLSLCKSPASATCLHAAGSSPFLGLSLLLQVSAGTRSEQKVSRPAHAPPGFINLHHILRQGCLLEAAESSSL